MPTIDELKSTLKAMYPPSDNSAQRCKLDINRLKTIRKHRRKKTMIRCLIGLLSMIVLICTIVGVCYLCRH